MKTNCSLLILPSCLAVVIIGTFLIWRIYPSANTPEASDPVYPTVSTQPTPVGAMNTLLAEQANNNTTKAAEELGGFFKTVIDQESGQYAIVNSNKTTVTLRDKNGEMIWSSDVIGTIPLGIQKYRGNKITGVELIHNDLYVFVGKAGFSIDKKTGKVTFVGSD